ncbi:MAG TPA: DUF3616 domain-containing protein [Blastocatellia bacterium]|nr:DUF3616 domain-containing protein [Blastocatellia bacterium]
MKEKTEAEIAKIKKYGVLASLALVALLVAGIMIYLPRNSSNDKADKKASDKADKKKKSKHKQDGAIAGHAIEGGTFEASDVVHVPGTEGVLFVDDNHETEVFWMQMNDEGEQVGAVKPIQLGGSVADPEGITSDGSNFYIVGSQSKAKGGDQNTLVRFQFDAANQSVTKAETIGDLRSFLVERVPELKDKKGEGGSLNIEGLAWDPARARLLLGLRSPLSNGQALVIALKFSDPKAGFSVSNLALAEPSIVRLPLGGLGIRGFEYDDRLKSFLIIAGAPEEMNRTEFKVWEWNGEHNNPTVREKASLNRDLKPEGIARVKSKDSDFLLVVCDSSRYLKLDEPNEQ